MSVPLQIGRSTPEVRNGGSLAVSHLSFSPFAGEGGQDSGCQVLWEDGERVFRRGWRLGEDDSRSPVLVVLPVAAHPSPLSLDRLTHEHGLKEELDRTWAMRPLEIVRDGGRTMLVLEDVGGFEPLDRLLAAPMEVESFLSVAIGIAVVIGKLHESGLVHKDIKPFNILLNRTTGEVKLTGFGIASRLPREHQAPDPPETIAGTLAYMAPEQTGRMNCSIDSRSDLYALGVTFYRMLTGVLPFSAADPMEWVHCHIARKPVAPSERLESVPAVLSGIVMKLLAKTAEDRYQTAAGLEHDLRRCTRRMGAPRAHRGVCARRTRQVRSAHDPGEAVRPGARGRDFARRLRSRGRKRRRRSWFWSRAIPASANLRSSTSCTRRSCRRARCSRQASSTSTSATSRMRRWSRRFRAWCGRCSARATPNWRVGVTPFLDALGLNGRLMVDLIPELKFIIGDQPPVPELELQQAQTRFQLGVPPLHRRLRKGRTPAGALSR